MSIFLASPPVQLDKSTGTKYSAEAEEVLRGISDLLKRKKLRVTDLFKKIDSGGDGLVTFAELKSGLAELGFKVSDQDLKVILDVIDKDGSGEFSWKELDKALKAAEKVLSQKDKEATAKKKRGLTDEDQEEFRQIFCLFKQLSQQRADGQGDEDIKLMEWDDSGSITVDDLEQLLETVGMKLSSAQLESMIREIDLDGDGEIDFQEFCTTMTKRIQIDYEPEQVAKAFKAFARNAPDGMIRVKDLKNALRTYMHSELTDTDVEELLQHYQDSFVKLPGSDQMFFRYQNYIDLMLPLSDRGIPSE